jgi:hypothetical protein
MCLLLVFVFFELSAAGQKILRAKWASWHSLHVWGDDFEGVVFKNNYEPYKKTDSLKRKKFTPTEDAIELVETILRKYLDTAKK